MESYSAFCKVSIAPVRAEERDQSEIVTQLLFGELITVYEINKPWARITTFNDNYSGFIDHKHLVKLSEKEVRRWSEGLSLLKERECEIQTPWGKQRICRGAYIHEGNSSFLIGNHEFTFINPPANLQWSIVEYAEDYLNTPYLWGGKSPYGIDCSGITQIIFRLFDKNLPRDASEQVDLGSAVEFEDIEPGDLAFFENVQGKVTHVGILDGKGKIYHAAGAVRLDEITKQGIIHSESKELTHSLTCIKRI